MNATVLAWSDRTSLKAALSYNVGFDKAIHLCATYSLRRGLLGLLNEHEQKGRYVLSIGQLIEQLCPSWFTARTQLEQYIHLTGILQQLSQRSQINARELRALRRGQRGLLEALRDLVQAGLGPGDVQPASEVEALACKAWARLERKSLLALPRARLYGEFVRMPKAFTKALTSSLEEQFRETGTDFNPQLVVLHGFYFITPIQFQLMRLLEASGARLVFCNFYDARFPEACRAWESFFRPKFGLQPPSNWLHFPPSGEPPLFARQFGDALAGKEPCALPAQEVTFEEYNDISGFARALSPHLRLDESQRPLLLSPDSEELTHRLTEFLPEMAADKRRHLLAYPVGRFFLHLHRMWNQEQAGLAIDELALRECVGSGWMRLAGRDARWFLPTIERLLPYFVGCRALDEWLKRAHRLQEARQALVAPFIFQPDAEAVSDRYQRFLSSPFERLSFFSVPEADIEAFTRLLLDLRDLAQSLFSNPEAEVAEHFRRLEKLLQDRSGQFLLHQEERSLIEVLKRSLREAQSVDLVVPREDLTEAVTLFLSGELEPDSIEEHGSDIQRFSNLDGVPLEYPEREIHLAACDEELLPHIYVGIAWPFARESILPNSELARQSSELLRAREESALDADVLLLFEAAALARKLTISWIRCRSDKKLGASTLLLPVLAPFGPYSILQHRVAPLLGLRNPPADSAQEVAQQAPAVGSHPPQALATWSICPRRFFYDFVLSDGPEWRSEFHHAFLLGGIVRGLERQFQLDGKVFKHLKRYLPHWPEARLKDACENAPPSVQGRFAYQGRLYPRLLDQLLLFKWTEPNAGSIRKVLAGTGQAEILSELGQQLSLDNGPALPVARPSPHCTLCPHQYHCDSALFHHELTDN